MRVVLIVHGLPPRERTGVETHVAELAAALARLGAEVLVCAARHGGDLPHLAERREERDGYRVHWLNLLHGARDPREAFDPPGVAQAFADFLERERPDVAHVHHLAKLGAGVVEELARRGIPAVFTAHDHWAVCQRATRLRPDLARCRTPLVAAACARCDAASAHLNGIPGLGDYQAGVLPEELSSGDRARLAEHLDGPREPEQAAVALQRELLERRRALLARFARVLVPSRFAADELVQAGVAPERLVHAPYGIERGPLAAVAPPAFEPGRALRFGYVGSLSKHKGVHVLLEAFARHDARGRAPAELVVHGGSSDAAYTAELARLARRAGARLAGAFDHGELPRVLASFDVLCVPSIWDEHAPFAIREAFAAGRPVLASAAGALSESVRDGLDGLLVAPGDADAWAAALGGLAAEPERARALAAGVRPPRALDESARELWALLEGLVRERRAAEATGSGLAHLAAIEARRRELARETLDDLRRRAEQGIARLRGALAVLGASDAAHEARAPSAAERVLQDRWRDQRRGREWLERSLDEGRRSGAELAAEVAWLRGELAAREAERAWMAERQAGAELAVEAAREEARWRAEQLAARERELAWLRGVAADHAAARAHYRRLAGLGPEDPATAAEPERGGGATAP